MQQNNWISVINLLQSMYKLKKMTQMIQLFHMIFISLFDINIEDLRISQSCHILILE